MSRLTEVLRMVPIDTQPRVLRRAVPPWPVRVADPQSRLGAGAMMAESPAMPAALPSDSAALEAALKEGRDAGYLAGHAAGLQTGYADGLERAQEQAQQELRATLEKTQHRQQEVLRQKILTIDQLVQALPLQWEQFLSTAVDDLLAMAMETLVRILGAQALAPDMVRQHILHVMSEWRGRAALEIHVHPDDLQWLQEDLSLAEQLQGQGQVKFAWIGDAQIGLGGCVLRSSEGGLDARFEVQLQQFKNTLLRVRAQRQTQRVTTP